MGFLWHFPSEGSLSYPFTNYTHNTSYRPNARGGPSPYFSQSLELCVCRQANISQLGFPTTRLHTYLSPTWSALYCVYIRQDGRNVSQISWSALCSYSGTQLPDNPRSSCHLLGLRLFIIRRPDYADAPYRKFLGLRYLTTRVPGRRDLDTQILGRTRRSWSASRPGRAELCLLSIITRSLKLEYLPGLRDRTYTGL